MSKFDISDLRSASVWSLYRMSDRIQVDPEYQRQGDVWPLDKRQLLIDTILNRFDIPKIYLHKFSKPKSIKGRLCDYAIVDGRQRLETMWSFIKGKIALADDFQLFCSPEVKAGGMTYQEIAKEHPDMKTDFDNFSINAVAIETDDLELIEEMFSRLNEAVPLTAAEKRNSWQGPVPVAVRSLSAEGFFKKKLPFGNKRYRHFDLALKFLLGQERNQVVDTKKVYLDAFVREYWDDSKTRTLPFLKKAKKTVKAMSDVFVDKDPLLRSVGMVSIYFHLFRIASGEKWLTKLTRQRLLHFETLRQKNRAKAEKDLATADYDLIEFDRFSQSPNDSYALKLRLKVLMERAFGRTVSVDSL
jgi:hypothetical protein